MNLGKIYDFLYEKRKALALLLLAFIVIFAFWLRYRLLGIKDMWIDEYFTEDGAFYAFSEMWKKGHTRTTLFFSVIMKYYAALLGLFNHKNYLTPFEVRLPNVIFGTLLVIQVYYIVRKISDSFTGILASLICALSPYLVYYSRDGRYYPLMLVCVAMCLWAAFAILSTPFDDKKQLKYHIAYMLGGFCGMFAHYGFWIFFALSNSILCLILCYRFFLEPSNDIFIKKIGKASLQVLSMAIPAFAVPFIVYKRYGTGVSVVFSDKLSTKEYLLQSLSYDSINFFCKDFYSDFKILALYSIFIIGLISILLLIFHKQRKIILYLATIRFFTFFLLRIIPRNIVHESLQTRYIIYILLIDIILFSLFFGELLKFIAKAFSKLSSKLSIAVYLLLAIILLFTVSYNSTQKTFNSKLNIYKPFIIPSNSIAKIKEFYHDGDIVLTDIMDIFYAVPYYRKIDKHLEDVNCYFIAWMNKPSNKNAGILLLTENHANLFPNLNYLGKHSGVYYSRYIIPDDLYGDDVAVIMSKAINTNKKHIKSTLDRWSQIKSNAIQYISVPHQEKNLILNPNFEQGFDNWHVTKHDDVQIDLINTNGHNLVRLSGKGGWSTISQSVFFEAGKTNKFIIDLKCDNRSKDLEIVFAYTDPDKKINYIDFPISRKTNEWTKTIKVFTFKKSGKGSVRIQYQNNTDEGAVYISKIKCVELRDKNAKISLSEALSKADSNQILSNSDFKEYYSYWVGETENFIINDSGDERIISFDPGSIKRTWFKLKQFFNAKNGDVYELSYDQRCLNQSTPKSDAFIVFSYIGKKGEDKGEKYFQLDTKGKTSDWKHEAHKINITENGKACLRLQFKGHPQSEVKNIKLIRIEEKN